LTPAFSIRDQALVVGRLHLDSADAQAIVKALLNDYETQWTTARTQLTASLSSHQGDHARQAQADSIRAFQRTQARLGGVLSDDIAVLLDEAGINRWTSLQHELWRLRRLRFGQLHAESLDLQLLVDDACKSMPSLKQPAVQDVLHQWQASLAELLGVREAFDSEGSTRYLALILERQYDAARTWITDWVDLRKAVNTLNLSTAKIIQQLLDPADAIAFETLVGDRVSLYVPHERAVDRVATSVQHDNAITASKKARVATIYQHYRTQTATMNAEREAIERTLEPLSILAPMQRRTGDDSLYTAWVAARQANEQRCQTLSQQSLDEICNVLGDDLCNRLVKTRSKGPSDDDHLSHPDDVLRDNRDKPSAPRPPFPKDKPDDQPTDPIPPGTPSNPSPIPFPKR
jgi:hypothetical protein